MQIDRRTFARLGFLVLIAPGASGCAKLYIHDSARERETAAAREQLDQLSLGDTFTRQEQILLAFATDEDAAVADYAAALRDQTLTQLIRPDPLDSSSEAGVTRLLKQVNGDLRTLHGTDVIDDRMLGDLAVLPQRRTLFNQHLERAQQDYVAATAEIQTLVPEGDGSYVCGALSPPALASQDEAVENLFRQIGLACRALAREDPINELELTGGRLADLRREQQELVARILAGRAQAKVLTDKINDLNDRAKDPAAPDLNSLIQNIKSQIEQAQPLAKLAGAQAINQVLEQLLTIELSDASAASDGGSGDTTSATTRRATAFLRLFDATSEAANAFSSEPNIQRVNSLLVALAGVRHELNMAQLEVDRDQDQLRIVEAQIDAVLRQLSELARARLLLAASLPQERAFADLRRSDPPQRDRAVAALAAYATAWNVGEIPYWVLVFRDVQIDRAFAVKQAATTAQDYRTVLQPALAQLEAYGAGGVPPEAIAQALGNLGIITAIVAR
jgi:hypothetical protein